MRKLSYAIVLAAAGLVLASAALAADTATRLTPDDLLRLAQPPTEDCYAVPPPASVTGAPPRLFAWHAEGGRLTVRVPVPADGYYQVGSLALLGPLAEGRMGRFLLTAGGVTFPGAYQGWYHQPPAAPYWLQEINWGVAHLSAPAADLSFEPAGEGGRLMILADLTLRPRPAAGLKTEDLGRMIAAAGTSTPGGTGVSPASGGTGVSPVSAATIWPLFDVKQMRGLEWSTLVPRAGKMSLRSDGSAGPIVIDGSLVPQRGWAAPPPESDADLSARVALSWDDKNLYLAAIVRDDEKTPHAAQDAWGSPFSSDGLVVNLTPPGWLTSGPRAPGTAPLEVMYGLSYYSPGASPRPLAPGCSYAVADTADGYTIQAVLSFASLGWTPAEVGDRFPLGLILVDWDPHKPAGRQFHQYGWNYGPGSTAGTGEARLLGAGAAAGEIIPERDTLAPGAPLRYVGTIDAQGPATVQALEVTPIGGGAAVATFPLGRALPGAGRYRVWGELPLPELPAGQYEVRMVWK